MSAGGLGTHGNPGFIDEGTSARAHGRPPVAHAGATPTQLERYATQAARALTNALSGIDTRDAIGGFLGGHSFTAGVVVGMGQNLVGSVVQLVQLLKMLALADYYESQHAHGFWQKFSQPLHLLTPLNSSMALASLFWPGFDHAARVAHDEREVLFTTVAYAFEHPGEVFQHITADQKQKYQAFKQYRERHSLVGEFRAGMLFGELLLDVLLIIDGVTAIAKLAAKIPGLLKLLPRLEKLAPELRIAVRHAEAAAKSGAAGSEGAEAGKAAGSSGTGSRPPQEGSASTAPKAPGPKAGQSQGGPGVWGDNAKGYPKKPGDAAYQQATTGAPQNLEYKVPTDRMASGEKWFDGYEPKTDRLIESKNYVDWPKENLPFSMKSATNEMRMSNAIAGDLGKTVEYRVATAEKATLLRDIADNNGFENIVVTHAKGN